MRATGRPDRGDLARSRIGRHDAHGTARQGREVPVPALEMDVNQALLGLSVIGAELAGNLSAGTTVVGRSLECSSARPPGRPCNCVGWHACQLAAGRVLIIRADNHACHYLEDERIFIGFAVRDQCNANWA